MRAKTKTKTKSWYVKKLDEVFSKFIRLSYSNDFERVQCYTCGKIDHWKNMQCGHYISRQYMSLRWDEDNCRVQCAGCNVFKHGNYTEYAYRLLKEIGRKGIDSLMNKKQTIKQWRIPELMKQIEYYKEKVSELE